MFDVVSGNAMHESTKTEWLFWDLAGFALELAIWVYNKLKVPEIYVLLKFEGKKSLGRFKISL